DSLLHLIYVLELGYSTGLVVGVVAIGQEHTLFRRLSGDLLVYGWYLPIFETGVGYRTSMLVVYFFARFGVIVLAVSLLYEISCIRVNSEHGRRFGWFFV